ncbi:MAG TPA: CHRD domain-containing protein, partial [Candidatus Eisenbacteria bacterium]|nr:CHRD domain-containing protein [Candidatus Eisenbacteria bacterium]
LPDGSYDAVKILTNEWADVAKFPVVQDPATRDFISAGPLGGKFGDVLLTPISAALAPYIVERNDTVAARRVEAIRLPAASKKSQVRLRFVHYGSCGWEWGVDNVAFYDIPGGTPQAVPLVITGITPVGQAGTITWTGGTGPYLLQRKFSLDDASWLNVLTTPDKSATVALQGAASFFRVVDGATTTVTPLTAFLSGDAERPTGNASTATGLGSFSLEGNTLNYYITFSGLSANASAAHIHGPTNTTASTSVIIPFSPPSATSGVISGSTNVSDLFKGYLLSGLTYANIHDTPNFGGGEIRGQIGPTQLKASLNGANENPPVSPAGTGSGILTRIGNQLLFNITYSGLSSPANNAHIHGRTDVSDPAGVLMALPTPTGTSGTLSGTLTLNNATLSAIVDGVAYVNIHTANNSGGEIRGQITP